MKKGFTNFIKTAAVAAPENMIFGGVYDFLTNTARQFTVFGMNAGAAGDTWEEDIPVAQDCTISDFYFETLLAPGAGEYYELVLTKNRVPTVFDLGITDAMTSITDLINSVSYSAGDTISLAIGVSGGAQLTKARWGFKATFN